MSDTFSAVKAQEEALLCRSYSRYPVAVVRGKGSRLWDVDGKEYVDLLRLEKAKELLEGSEMKIENVAEKVGYNSSYSFARFFKKHMGVSPKEYRDIKVI